MTYKESYLIFTWLKEPFNLKLGLGTGQQYMLPAQYTCTLLVHYNNYSKWALDKTLSGYSVLDTTLCDSLLVIFYQPTNTSLVPYSPELPGHSILRDTSDLRNFFHSILRNNRKCKYFQTSRFNQNEKEHAPNVRSIETQNSTLWHRNMSLTVEDTTLQTWNPHTQLLNCTKDILAAELASAWN